MRCAPCLRRIHSVFFAHDSLYGRLLCHLERLHGCCLPKTAPLLCVRVHVCSLQHIRCVQTIIVSVAGPSLPRPTPSPVSNSVSVRSCPLNNNPLAPLQSRAGWCDSYLLGGAGRTHVTEGWAGHVVRRAQIAGGCAGGATEAVA